MKISGRTTSDSVFAALPHSGVSYESHSLDVDARVRITTYSLTHQGPETNYRPRVHLQGEILGLRASETAEVDLPYQIEEVGYVKGLAPQFNAFYDFSQEQLVELTRRGYFQQNFDINAEAIRANDQIVLPVDRLPIYIVAPDAEEGIPLVFVDFSHLSTLYLDEESTGYDLVEVVASQVEHDGSEIVAQVEESYAYLNLEAAQQTQAEAEVEQTEPVQGAEFSEDGAEAEAEETAEAGVGLEVSDDVEQFEDAPVSIDQVYEDMVADVVRGHEQLMQDTVPTTAEATVESTEALETADPVVAPESETEVLNFDAAQAAIDSPVEYDEGFVSEPPAQTEGYYEGDTPEAENDEPSL